MSFILFVLLFLNIVSLFFAIGRDDYTLASINAFVCVLILLAVMKILFFIPA